MSRYIKGTQGSGNKGNFESGQNKSKVCSYIFKDGECSPLYRLVGLMVGRPPRERKVPGSNPA